MTTTIIKTLADLLSTCTADCYHIEHATYVLNSAPVVTQLMPNVLAAISNITKTDPKSAVQVIGLIKEILPKVAELNKKELRKTSEPSPNASVNLVPHSDPESSFMTSEDSLLPSPHYAWVESDHPYKSASVANYKVRFPSAVHWMTVEFDPKCSTAQPEDILQLYIRSPGSGGQLSKSMVASSTPVDKASPTVAYDVNGEPISTQLYTPVLKKFHGSSNWPQQAVILPGNEILFSLETASDYVKDEKVKLTLK